MNEFSVRPFAAGVVVGLRAFRAGSDGHLTGVTHQVRWEAGENLAVCRKGPFGSFQQQPDSDHQVAGLTCQCGFYAYFDGSRNDYFSDGVARIAGIVEAYGVVTIGSRGFRAARSRIVALVKPGPPVPCFCGCGATPFGVDLDAVQATYPDVPVYDTQEQAIAAHLLTKAEDVGITPAESAEASWWSGGPVYGRAWGKSYAQAAAQAATAVFQTAMQRAWSPSATDIQSLTDALTDKTESGPPLTPVERKRAAAELAARRRAQNRLSNIGGINRRRRNL